ncbi:uncharacterized protein PGTG_06624 [Puccinia graminis f. sp. tritici CRL 75-36-700-3]|uniref:Uncharacterized protein n=1 Tax=Puccinia graminis f. sp. tritici (strain CRL 75-36-700-3 / race SCCL) TaxID=418459 RepID=E3K907_PUCGT|nr:uncharacterized protein PGTG_06624 [Puccinia graminis f. sp. tritici CRL 75-36-700-3]EFP80668.1 hypothetical protein PGTG_06624 [Puccinia graminis f. sp. tritici CRL 75-36-700-3]
MPPSRKTIKSVGFWLAQGANFADSMAGGLIELRPRGRVFCPPAHTPTSPLVEEPANGVDPAGAAT